MACRAVAGGHEPAFAFSRYCSAANCKQ